MPCDTSDTNDGRRLHFSGNEEASRNESEIPIGCVLDESRRMFKIYRSKGKALSSGGFGVSISSEECEIKERDSQEKGATKGDETAENDAEDSITTAVSAQASTAEYLFVEEVLFLRERGLLECIDRKPIAGTEIFRLDSSQLFRMLSTLDISLAMYLVYAHLRSQDFRVLRHAPGRLRLLKQQEESINLPRKDLNQLRRHVRDSIAQAQPPVVPEEGLCICWDAYHPNSQFGKTHPGLPDFYVAVTYYNRPIASFLDVQALVKSKCQGIPLKIATVSDSGTVVMFGVTSFGVPSISDPQQNV